MSYLCIPPQLQLFEDKLPQFAIEKTTQIEMKPLASLENARVIQFNYRATGDEYR